MNFQLDLMNYAEEIGYEQPDWAQSGETMKVYRVPIDKLFYNEDNGRIATYISSYDDLTNEKKLDELTLDEYNKLLQDFIKKSNPLETFKKTKNDIFLKGQIRPGVALNNGRVVSGNRRFTVLRELYQETGNDKFSSFKCFILDKNPENIEDRKYIKTIERLTQFGVDEKVDYDPIARLVDIYHDLLGENKIWNIKEYSQKLNLKKSDVETMVSKAEIMVDYLEYINRPNKFYIARKRKMDGPLQDLVRLYKKIEKKEWKRIRPLFYSVITEEGDRTRTVRGLVNTYFTTPDSFDEALQKCVSDIEKREIEIINKTTSPEENIVKLEIQKAEDTLVQGVLSEDTKTQIFQVTNMAKITQGRNKKVDRLFKSLETILISLQETYQLLNSEERIQFNEYIEKIAKLFLTYKGE